MARRIKSLSVTPEERRKWLARHDEEGESVPRIALKDGYDVRTVRKQIEAARQEREMRESRMFVLRDAVQGHYQDLCKFVQKIDAAVTGGDSLAELMKDRMYAALKQHLQKSPLWKNLDKWNSSWEGVFQANDDLRKELGDELAKDPDLTQAFAGGKDDITGMVAFLAIQAWGWKDDGANFDINEWFKTDAGENGTLDLKLGASNIGNVPSKQAPKVKRALAAFIKRITALSEYQKRRGWREQMKQLVPEIREELATIVLRRVVPGRCKYCPV